MYIPLSEKTICISVICVFFVSEVLSKGKSAAALAWCHRVIDRAKGMQLFFFLFFANSVMEKCENAKLYI